MRSVFKACSFGYHRRMAERLPAGRATAEAVIAGGCEASFIAP
jgi:hypothetical protein